MWAVPHEPGPSTTKRQLSQLTCQQRVPIQGDFLSSDFPGHAVGTAGSFFNSLVLPDEFASDQMRGVITSIAGAWIGKEARNDETPLRNRVYHRCMYDTRM